MSARRNIAIPEYCHKMPIPAATVVGDFLTTSLISGKTPHTQDLPPELDAQLRNVFRYVRQIVEAAGGGLEHIAKMTFWMTTREHRKFLQPHWEAMFPDVTNQPARHTLAADLEGGKLVECVFEAVLPSRSSE